MPDDPSLTVKRLLPRLLATVVIPVLALGCLSWPLFGAGAPSGPARVAAGILAIAAVLGIAAGGWLTARPGRSAIAAREAAGDAGETLESLRSTVADQAAAIARYDALVDEMRTELAVTQARLNETSFKDELTGLYNRRFFFVRLEEEMSRHRRFNHPVAVVLFDLDGFKEVNDGQGHMIGDETLRDIGQLLTKHSRGINVVARYGGDEFAILLVETSTEGARLYAERVRQILSGHPYSHGMHVTASFGVASLPDDHADTAEELVRHADVALYVAKRGGRNQVAGGRARDAQSA